MDGLSPAGVTGALLGLVMGWVDYVIAGGIIERKLKQSAADRAGHGDRIQRYRRLVLIATVGVFPIVGYVFGHTIIG